jgi:diguanylate cyclase (GGDEF)-like protein/putative nucleotidyltransferase with HDIG domain
MVAGEAFMKELTIPTRLYIFTVYITGAILLAWNLVNWQIKEPVLLVILCVLASFALIIKVEGATNRSHYTFSFILYGFAFAHLGVPQAMIVILVSNLVEWLYKRDPWFIQVFNTFCYIIVIYISGVIFLTLNPSLLLTTPQGILAMTLSMAGFTLLNHLIVGIIVWMARGENFKESGIFDPLPLFIDLTLLSLGAMLVLVWDYSPYALILFAFPIYLIYVTMRVPALERQTEIDQKTGLFNHRYFMEHLENELKRANRFDRPLTIIMADLDLLRNINNTYGHLAGDEVLIGIANILRQSVREYDVVARFGGEEFSILLPETTLSQGYQRAEAIRKAVENATFMVPTNIDPIKATLSLGVASREFFDQSGKDIIHNADTALYKAKLNGRNRALFFDHSIDEIPDSVEAVPVIEEKMIAGPVKQHPQGSTPTPYRAAETKINTPSLHEESPLPQDKVQDPSPSSSRRVSNFPVNLYIAGLFILSILSFGGLYWFAPRLYTGFTTQSWVGLSGFILLVGITEWLSIDLYTKQTSLSTSAVPILAGTLLFGPIGSILLSLTYAIFTSIKHRSPFNRLVFNFSNQLLVGMLYISLLSLTGRTFVELPISLQFFFAILSASIVFFLNTILISIGVHIDTGQPVIAFWKEHYNWLFLIYLGMGVVAAAFVFGYLLDPLIGSLLVVVPILLLRLSQVQYVERTRDMVAELRQKNFTLQKFTDEISKLNDGLLDTLAEIIDLRDPYVLGHSRKVTILATQIARQLGLHDKQVELIRRGSLLHDIGKLGIPPDILAKPKRLSPDEYRVIQEHPLLGCTLLENSPYLRPLIPIVRHHHEYYNGEGYPDKLSGNQISIEARIVSVADAIEAMSSDRPYRKSISTQHIIEELQNCANKQFDPLVAQVAIDILKEMEPDVEPATNAKPLQITQLKPSKLTG